MPSKYDENTKAMAVRSVREHRDAGSPEALHVTDIEGETIEPGHRESAAQDGQSHRTRPVSARHRAGWRPPRCRQLRRSAPWHIEAFKTGLSTQPRPATGEQRCQCPAWMFSNARPYHPSIGVCTPVAAARPLC